MADTKQGNSHTKRAILFASDVITSLVLVCVVCSCMWILHPSLPHPIATLLLCCATDTHTYTLRKAFRHRKCGPAVRSLAKSTRARVIDADATRRGARVFDMIKDNVTMLSIAVASAYMVACVRCSPRKCTWKGLK